jgi:hypothetical protein
LVHHAGEIVTAWRIWRARPRADAVEILLDSLIEFERAINPERLRFEEWQAGGSVNYGGSRAAGVALCGLVEVYVEIIQRTQLTDIIGGDGIVEGTIDAEQLRAVENAVDSLARLVEILRAEPAVSEVAPAEIPSKELIGQCDLYADLQQFAETELRGQEREFLLMAIEAMRQEPEVGLTFSTLSLKYRHQDFDCVSYSKNKLQKLKAKLQSSTLPYKLSQRSNAAIIEVLSS